jgi:hypothetical protein
MDHNALRHPKCGDPQVLAHNTAFAKDLFGSIAVIWKKTSK